MTLEIEHRDRLPVSAETYWSELCTSLAYTERLYREALGCTAMEVLATQGSLATGLTRRLRFQKPIDAPAAIAKIFGNSVSIEEHGEFDPAAQCWRYRMVPALLADRIDIRGMVRLSPVEGGVEQLSSTRVSCRLFGLGAIIEPFMARSAEEGHRDKRAFTQRYVAELGLAAAAQ